MRVLVTGASGQLGLPLVRELSGRGHAVSALVRNAAKEEAVRSAGGQIVSGGFEPEVLAKALEGVDAVMHLAGGARGRGKETAAVINGQLTQRLVAALGARRPKVVFASSAVVYGDRSGLWVPEDFPPNPQTNYGNAKVQAEQTLEGSGVPLVIARIAAVYGPGIRFTGEDRLRAGRGWLPGEGKNLVPLVHVHDCVRALADLMERGEPGVWHVAGKSTPLLREFYAEVQKACAGKPMRFWSTWIPSAFQNVAAKENERLATIIGAKPRFTVDNLKIYTASLRLRTDKLEKQLGFTWQYPDHVAGIAASIQTS